MKREKTNNKGSFIKDYFEEGEECLSESEIQSMWNKVYKRWSKKVIHDSTKQNERICRAKKLRLKIAVIYLN